MAEKFFITKEDTGLHENLVNFISQKIHEEGMFKSFLIEQQINPTDFEIQEYRLILYGIEESEVARKIGIKKIDWLDDSFIFKRTSSLFKRWKKYKKFHLMDNIYKPTINTDLKTYGIRLFEYENKCYFRVIPDHKFSFNVDEDCIEIKASEYHKALYKKGGKEWKYNIA